MSAARLRRLLAVRGREWPAPLESFAELSSTNDYLRERARESEPWRAVIADSQSAGRGRRGSSWASPPGNLYLSVVLPPTTADCAGLIPLAAGLACAEALLEFGVEARLKWPNDVVAEGRKLAGILVEAASSGGRLEQVVLGVGVNVQSDPGASDPALRDRTTSIAVLCGRLLDPAEVAATFLDRLFVRHGELLEGVSAALLAGWRERSVAWWGRLVEVLASGQREQGTAVDVDPVGALLLRREDGSLVRILAGEARELRLRDAGR